MRAKGAQEGYLALSMWFEYFESSRLSQSDGMRRPVSGRDAVGSQVIDALEAQKIKETGNEEG
jgi:hypothetical protein